MCKVNNEIQNLTENPNSIGQQTRPMAAQKETISY